MKRRNIGICLFVLCLLVVSFFWGEDFSKEDPGEDAPQTYVQMQNSDSSPETEQEEPVLAEEPEKEPEEPKTASPAEEKSQSPAAPVKAEQPAPAEPAEPTALTTPEPEPTQPVPMSCVLSVRCDDVLANMDKLAKEKAAVIPKDGVIFPEQTVFFSEGESAFDVLCRELKNKKIHMEFVSTPMYHSVYIEGIGNLYEFDCGETSGWMYAVNGTTPTYGCSLYQLKAGDKITFFYQCDLFAKGK